jgi:hypothetical protein
MSNLHQTSVGTALHPGMPLPGFGLPEERMARMAAHTAFTELKYSFMRATAEIEGGIGLLLQRQVLLAKEAVELWRLRGAVFAALPLHSERSRLHKAELHQQLDSVFPDCGDINGFASR